MFDWVNWTNTPTKCLFFSKLAVYLQHLIGQNVGQITCSTVPRKRKCTMQIMWLIKTMQDLKMILRTFVRKRRHMLNDLFAYPVNCYDYERVISCYCLYFCWIIAPRIFYVGYLIIKYLELYVGVHNHLWQKMNVMLTYGKPYLSYMNVQLILSIYEATMFR